MAVVADVDVLREGLAKHGSLAESEWRSPEAGLGIP